MTCTACLVARADVRAARRHLELVSALSDKPYADDFIDRAKRHLSLAQRNYADHVVSHSDSSDSGCTSSLQCDILEP